MQNAYFAKPSQTAVDNLKAVVGKSGWSLPNDAPRYLDDPRGRFEGKGCLILHPASTQQVSDIVRLCNASKIGLVPYSGGTGVVAGQLSIESENAVIVSLEKMNRIRDVSVDDRVMIAEAGCILERIHYQADDHEMVFPLSMASKGSCCIGGNLATNAGGIQVLRFGNARDLCLGIEAVLPDGQVLDELSPLRKNNTGYDLRHLLIGSEGTLGIITAAALKLFPKEPEIGTSLLAINSPAAGLEVYKILADHLGGSLSAIELMSGFGLDLVTSKFQNLRNPFENTSPWILLLECSGQIGLINRLEAALSDCFERNLLNDAVVAQSDTQRNSLWDLREYTPEANKLAGAFCNSDTSVAVSKIDAFISDTHAQIASLHDGIQINSYGHLGDGNIHHNVFPPKGIDKQSFLNENPGIIDKVRLAINDVTHAHEGSISAEHGIGRLKPEDLELYAGTAKLDMLRRIKSAIDPNNIMNPGALVR